MQYDVAKVPDVAIVSCCVQYYVAKVPDVAIVSCCVQYYVAKVLLYHVECSASAPGDFKTLFSFSWMLLKLGTEKDLSELPSQSGPLDPGTELKLNVLKLREVQAASSGVGDSFLEDTFGRETEV
jgi:hypothetical protein